MMPNYTPPYCPRNPAHQLGCTPATRNVTALRCAR